LASGTPRRPSGPLASPHRLGGPLHRQRPRPPAALGLARAAAQDRGWLGPRGPGRLTPPCRPRQAGDAPPLPDAGEPPPTSRQVSQEGTSAAGVWTPPGRSVRTAAVMHAGDSPRLVIPSWRAPRPPQLYTDREGARGQCATTRLAVQVALQRERTS